jgi:hypothetical protein
LAEEPVPPEFNLVRMLEARRASRSRWLPAPL